jgi:tRNA(fMet)-specific endonuclease VapC
VSFILDSDHCVAILRGRLDPSSHIAPTTPLFITAITVSELVYGAYKSDRRDKHLAQVNLLLDSVTVLPFDEGQRAAAARSKICSARQARRSASLIYRSPA